MSNNKVLSPLVAAKQSIAPTGRKYSKSYKKFFEQVTSYKPFPYQIKYHETKSVHGYKGLSVPTGTGKTNCVIVDWLYRRIHNPTETPRRLFLVVPLRTLVTQLTSVIQEISNRSGLELPVYQMVGGNIQDDWVEHPEQPAIVITTLDQLVSRQLLRPFTASVKSSLIAFAATNDDCTIVLDETQLQGEALGTSIQLHELLLQQPSFHNRELVLCSATNDTSLVDKKTFDFQEITLSAADYRHPIAGAKVNNEKTLDVYTKMSDQQIVELAEARHRKNGLTLIICNTVARCQSVYSLLDREDKMLLHSRFRKADRSKLEKKVVDFKGIVVSSQVIECGLDISADVLVTEMSPWSSLAQRAGRVARKPNTSGEIHVIEPSKVLPYAQYEIEACGDRLLDLDDFSIKSIMSVPLPESLKRKPVQIDLTFIKRMFDPRCTEPISQFIRNIHSPMVGIAYRYPRHLGVDMPKLDRNEICPLYPTQLLEIIGKRKDIWVLDQEEMDKQKTYKAIWRKWDWKTDKIEPGTEICAATTAKNYSKEMGLLLGSKDRVNEIYEKSPKRIARGGYGDDSKNAKLSLVAHLMDAKNYAKRICSDINLHFGEFDEMVIQSALFHDIGKSMDTFQNIIGIDGETDRSQRDKERAYAKGDFYIKNGNYIYGDRTGYRHECGSFIPLMEMGADPLMVFLVASHHGQISANYRSMREYGDNEDMICGIKEGDVVHAIKGSFPRDLRLPEWLQTEKGYFFPEFTFKHPTEYVSRYRKCFDDCYTNYGPMVLAYLSSLVRISDHRASAWREAPDNDEN